MRGGGWRGGRRPLQGNRWHASGLAAEHRAGTGHAVWIGHTKTHRRESSQQAATPSLENLDTRFSSVFGNRIKV